MNYAKLSLDQLKNIKTFLEHLTDADLAARLAKLEEMGKATKARMEAGERGPVVGQHMERGRWTNSHSLETALNGQRHAWSMTRLEQRRRAAQVS
jgi:hypothetical protein